MITTLPAYLLSFLIALAGGALANLLGLPIPWLLGSLLAIGGCSLAGLPIKNAEIGRKTGLMIIGLSLGLYFSPQMLDLIAQSVYLLIAVAIFSITLGIIGSIIAYRIGKVSFKTAWFASVVGGASEMSNLAQLHNARVDLVVAAHTLRVFLLVTTVPFFYQFMGYHGEDSRTLESSQAVNFVNLLLLLALGALAAKYFEYKKWSNPWTFAPLLVAAILTANEVHLSAIPPVLSYLGQVCIGWTLGTKFRPNFFQVAPRLLTATAISVLIHLMLTLLMVWLLTHYSDIDKAILGLGFAPGGVAEMTITAKTLQLGVPIVTMLHVVRMIAVVASAGVLYHWLDKYFIKQ